MRGHDLYRPVDAALLRASVSIDANAVPDWPDRGERADVEAWRRWISQVWTAGDLAEAVTAASPVLADRVAAVRAGEVREVARLRQVAVSLARYVVRLRGRATPFGLFAGVASLRFGAHTRGLGDELADGRLAVARADAAWLASVITRLESCPALLGRLPVITNDLAVVRGGRLAVPWWPHVSGRPTTAVMVSLRYTAPVRYALQAACSSISAGVLAGKLAAEFPRADESAVRELIASLVAAGALVSSLRPPLTVVDGLGHLLAELALVDAAGVPEAAPVVGELLTIQAALTARSPSAVTDSGETTVAARMRALADTGTPPVAVDLLLAADVTLPASVAAQAATAASALARLSPHPGGAPALREYHRRFLDRFGPGTVVPVAQLVAVTGGLGYPRHHLAPAPARRAEFGLRDERLLALAQRAALDGAREVLLDDDTISHLGQGTTQARADGRDGPRMPPHLDLCVEILAVSVAALDAGDFLLAVTGIGQSAVATSGRFLSLLPGTEQDRLVEAYASLPVAVDGALPAQVSFPPLRARAGNVLAVPPVLPAVISVGEHRAGGTDNLDLRDLAVMADVDRMYVVSLSRRRVVEPTLVCAAARHAVPPLARLLVDVAQATAATVGLFDWGAAAGLPFQPRLRYRRTILTPARWQVPLGELPGTDAPLSTWAAAMTALRNRLRLPGQIAVGVADRQLRLRLDDPMHLALLRAHIRGLARTTPSTEAEPVVTLTEAPSEAEHGWCRGGAHEVLIPMAGTAAPGRAPAVLTRPGPLPQVDAGDDILPGTGMLYAKVYGDPDGFTTVLVDHLPALLAEWDAPPRWWFVRYHDPAPHLRIRLHTTDYGRAAVRVGAWAAELRRHGLTDTLTLDTYRPEPARYGRGGALAAAEELFAADSAAALSELAASTAVDGSDQQALTAASLADLAGVILGGRAAGLAWLIKQRDGARTVPMDREARRQALRLAATYTDLDASRATVSPASAAVAGAWRARRNAASAYTRLLGDGRAGMTPTGVVGSLLHLHHNRVHGPGSDAEARTHRLARAIALAGATGAQR